MHLTYVIIFCWVPMDNEKEFNNRTFDLAKRYLLKYGFILLRYFSRKKIISIQKNKCQTKCRAASCTVLDHARCVILFINAKLKWCILSIE